MCRGMQVCVCECVCVWVSECVCECVCVCVCECVSERVCMFSQYQVMIGELQADVDFKERWVFKQSHRVLCYDHHWTYPGGVAHYHKNICSVGRLNDR